MLDSTPERPGGNFASTDCRFCSPSLRLIVSVNGEKAPALRFSAPPVKVGLNGRLAPGQGPPCGPCSIGTVEAECTVTFSSSFFSADHGTNDAVVSYSPGCSGVLSRHCAGVASGAFSPPKKWNSASSKGT